MKKLINNLHFRSKIIWLFGIMLLISTAVTGLGYYQYTSRDIEENFKVGAEDVLAQLVDTLDMRFHAIRQRSEGLLTNNTFVVGLSDYLNSPSDINLVKTMGMVSTFLKDLESGESLIHSTYIYTEKQEFDNFVCIRNQQFDFKASDLYQSYVEQPLKSIRWFSVRKNQIFQGGENVIPYVRKFSVLGYDGWEYLVIQLKQSELEELLAGKYEFFDKLLITDQDGQIIAGSEDLDTEELKNLAAHHETAAGVIAGDYEDQGETYLVTHESLEENGWQIYGLKSKQVLLGSLKRLRTMIVELMGIVFLAGMGVILLLSHQMTTSLRRLEKRMSCVQNGDLNARFFYPYRDEVGSLAQSFNYMMGEIQGLVVKQEETIEELRQEKNYAAEIQKQKRKAELKALQAQINPHFLYNTLNAITWQAADQGAEEISILSNALGKFFRVSLSRGAEIITLREELEHVASYLDIQSIRYHSRLSYQIQVAEDWMHMKVIKLILQPLAENSIYHGIKEKEGMGVIRIWAEPGVQCGRPVLRMVVWDNGLGINQDKLSAMNAALSGGTSDHTDGYGIYNVNERIRLFYGEAYGLSFESEYGQWTKAMLTLPAEVRMGETADEGGDKDVSHIDC